MSATGSLATTVDPPMLSIFASASSMLSTFTVITGLVIGPASRWNIPPLM